ncbi:MULTISPECIES: hypothetical protein [Pseudoalteromonas]|uniref:hypothetical protein n=1 Tax=Pseudoalteromonas TaxID=53246 RepID=UPI0015819A45|nr:MULTISPECIES: hypothetical protein [Pseudoalteromonas]MDI4654646.1 hypothetical protein [Pseudoalteromonas shioyasakiensis]NUJ41036.1 hypothetical protein [Pseudoalteromonas sp. 0303]
MLNIKNKILNAEKKLPNSLRELQVEDSKKVSGGNFGKGCVGTWSEGVSGFKQQCQP